MSEPEFIKGACAACGGHLEFPAGGAGTTIPCPHCGQLTELTAPAKKSAGGGKIILVASLFVVLASAVLAARWMLAKKPAEAAPAPGIAAATSPEIIPAPSNDAVTTNDFAIAQFNLEKKPGSSLVYVTGTLRNLAARQRFGVRVEFALLDRDENSAGTAKDYVPVMEPNGVWMFKALVLGSKAVSAKFSSVREDQ